MRNVLSVHKDVKIRVFDCAWPGLESCFWTTRPDWSFFSQENDSSRITNGL